MYILRTLYTMVIVTMADRAPAPSSTDTVSLTYDFLDNTIYSEPAVISKVKPILDGDKALLFDTRFPPPPVFPPPPPSADTKANTKMQALIANILDITIKGNTSDPTINATALEEMNPCRMLGDWTPQLASPGPPGARGERGLTGPSGPPGPTGPRGFQGPVGPKGDRGLIGPVGFPGDKGSRGRRGRRGKTGPVGPPGPGGPKGERGQPGLIGISGTDGIPGRNGDKGDRGSIGPRGYQGTKGPTGLPGPPGTPGKDGGRGQNGVPGVGSAYIQAVQLIIFHDAKSMQAVELEGLLCYRADVKQLYFRDQTTWRPLRIQQCGDGIVDKEQGEQCDDGNEKNNDHCIDCKRSYCGDGHRNKHREECDGRDFGGRTCSSWRMGMIGTLQCTRTCKINYHRCRYGER